MPDDCDPRPGETWEEYAKRHGYEEQTHTYERDRQPLPDGPQTCDAHRAGDGPQAVPLIQLDTQETSVGNPPGDVVTNPVIDFEKWMATRGSPESYFETPIFDESSASARFRHSGWWVIRKRVWESLQRTAAPKSRLLAFGSCGSCSWLERGRDDPNLFRVRYNHCHDRLCTPCANARSFRLSQAVLNLIERKPVSFITLTLCGKNEKLGALLDRLLRSFRALRAQPMWEDNVRGGCAFLEIKHSAKANRWHPHLHILADANFIDKHDLSDMWRSITKDSFIVDIRRVKNPDITAHYVTKYASKPLNTSFSSSPTHLDEAVRALHGRRLCLCFGSWYGSALSDAEDAPLTDEDSPAFTFFCPLEEILDKANRGNRDAIHILTMANAADRWRASLVPMDSS